MYIVYIERKVPVHRANSRVNDKNMIKKIKTRQIKLQETLNINKYWVFGFTLIEV